jgi:hypothetical protein
MSAFKTLLTSDIIVTPFEVNKTFTFEGSASLANPNVGIDRFYGNYVPKLQITNPVYYTGYLTTQSRGSIYNSIQELYYSNYSASRYNASGSYENYLANTLNNSVQDALGAVAPNGAIDRYFPHTSSYAESTIGVVSIPTRLYGEGIQPGSVRLKTATASLADDGQGNIYDIASYVNVGNVIYEHGLIVITSNITIGVSQVAKYGKARYGGNYVYTSATGVGKYLIPEIISGQLTCSFTSRTTLYETQVKCTISPNEFTATLNPTIFQNTGSVYGFATGSYFGPYITTVGLYNENQDLLAVAKLSQPIQSSPTTDTTILINLDR